MSLNCMYMISSKESAPMMVEASKFTIQKAGQQAGAWAGADVAVSGEESFLPQGNIKLCS